VAGRLAPALLGHLIFLLISSRALLYIYLCLLMILFVRPNWPVASRWLSVTCRENLV